MHYDEDNNDDTPGHEYYQREERHRTKVVVCALAIGGILAAIALAIFAHAK